MPTETVLAISDKEENAYQALLQESSRAIKIFDIGDDVLDHLANNTTPQDRGCGGIGSYDDDTWISGGGGVNHRPYVKFFRGGVYFKLSCGFDSYSGYPSATAKSMEI